MLVAVGVSCSKNEKPGARGSEPTPEKVASAQSASHTAAPASALTAGAAAPAASHHDFGAMTAGQQSAASGTAKPAPAPLQVVRDGQRVAPARATRVLHFGDSMVPLVANYLRPLVEKQGGEYEIVSTSSSTTLTWAEGDQLEQLLTQHDPELVLVSLGSNELFFVDDLNERAKAIKDIVGEIGARACLWIGPPAWAKDRGFLETLQENLGTCGYFDSTLLNMQRQEDGRHPTWGASHKWAGEVWKHLGGDTPLPR